MATIIEFSLPTEEFALEETLDTHPGAHNEIELRVAIPNPLWGLPGSIHSVLKNEPLLELRDFQGSESGETMRLWIVVHMDE